MTTTDPCLYPGSSQPTPDTAWEKAERGNLAPSGGHSVLCVWEGWIQVHEAAMSLLASVLPAPSQAER